MSITEVSSITGLTPPPEEMDEGVYRTLSGFILHRLGHVPKEGETLVCGNVKIEVTDTDRQRIDKVTLRRVAPAVIAEIS